ncbi:MAG: N-acetylmuramoyl-L-alanine amidase [Spirochaetaceae bacterium]|nr:N-acetylmuramoyl-L-alanine amidase [Spirochaetaceae bacterium]
MSPLARLRAGAAFLCLAFGLLPGPVPRAVAAEAAKPAVVAQSLGAAAAAARLKARLSWDPLTGSGVLERNGFRVSLALGSAKALFDYHESLSLDPPFDPGSGLRFTEASVAALEERFSKAEELRRSRFSVAAILIDPGHGGKDSGAVGEHSIGGKKIRVVEKDLALDLSLRVYKALKARFPERRILLTRSGDSYPTLEERVEMANDVDLADH